MFKYVGVPTQGSAWVAGILVSQRHEQKNLSESYPASEIPRSKPRLDSANDKRKSKLCTASIAIPVPGLRFGYNLGKYVIVYSLETSA